MSITTEQLDAMLAAATPGPWICYADIPSADPNWHIVTTANKLRVLANVHIEPGNSVDPANAAIIAAAPEVTAELIAARRKLEAVQAMVADRKDAMSIQDALETLSAMASVQDGYAKKATDPGLRIIHKANAKAQRAVVATVTTLATENATLRAEFELLTAVKDAHKMRGDNHWETLRSIRVLAQEGKLDHIIQHVNDAGAGYTQPDHVTMWELQSALAVANDRIATLRASEAAALAAIKEPKT